MTNRTFGSTARLAAFAAGMALLTARASIADAEETAENKPPRKSAAAATQKPSQKANEASPGEARRRLPPHYAKVVDAAQRYKIYRIQAKYADRKAELRKQLAAIQAEETAEIDSLLTDDQKQQLAELKEEALKAKTANKGKKPKKP